MADPRLFPKQRTNIGGQFVCVRVIKCSECGQPGEIIDQTHQGLPSLQIKRMFLRKGWDVGTNEKHDFCPLCVVAKTAERRARTGGRLKAIHVAPQEATPMSLQTTNAIPPSASEAPVPEMGRSDKRVIFAKLEEVYGNDCYKTPWNDAMVAKDLGVPMAWVAMVRDDNFGPAADNAEIRDMFERVRSYATEAQAILAEAKAIRADGAALVERINALAKNATEIGKKLDGVLIIGERVERSLKA